MIASFTSSPIYPICQRTKNKKTLKLFNLRVLLSFKNYLTQNTQPIKRSPVYRICFTHNIPITLHVFISTADGTRTHSFGVKIQRLNLFGLSSITLLSLGFLVIKNYISCFHDVKILNFFQFANRTQSFCIFSVLQTPLKIPIPIWPCPNRFKSYSLF